MLIARLRSALAALATALVLASGSAALAQPVPLTPAEVPAPLQPWIGWAVDNAEDHGCAWVPGIGRACVWPGDLAVTLNAGGARFTVDVSLDRAALVPLPGDPRHWPEEVSADQHAVQVRSIPVQTAAGTGPAVALGPGRHRVEGRFVWSEQPETLAIPPSTAHIALSTASGPVRRPRVDRESSTLWLQTATREAADEDSLSIEVYRRLEDGAAISIATRVVLDVSGRPREITLGRILVPDTLPVAVRSDLPLRLSATNEVTVQAHPGPFEVEVTALAPSPETTLTVPDRSAVIAGWPDQEVWVWVADDALRQAQLNGLDLIDPERTNLPADWRGLPTYLVSAEHRSLEIGTVRRGNPSPAPNQVHVVRELWLDPDGTGWTGIDTLHGEIDREWRLEFAGGELGRAMVNHAPHLISTVEGRPGIEIRHGALQASGEWRNETANAEFLAVGWTADVQSLDATLHLAPGFGLLAASGVDSVESSWVSQWTLWGLFFVLVVAVALGRLAGWQTGVVSFLVLALSYHQPDAPIFVWIPLVIAFALAHALPRGRLRDFLHIVYYALFAFLALLSFYFGAFELRRGLWPYSVEESYGSVTDYSVIESGEAVSRDSDEGGMGRGGGSYPSAPMGGMDRRAAEEQSQSANLTSYEPNAVLQTGPGVPGWQSRGGQSIRLSWTGPVTADAKVNLWVISPLANAALAVLRVGLLALLLFLLHRARPRALPPAPDEEALAPPPTSAPPSESTAVMRTAIALVLLALFASPAHAQPANNNAVPSAGILEALRERLLRAPACAPDCAELVSTSFVVQNDRLTIEAEVSASAPSAIALPGPANNWVPETILVDGVSAPRAARLANGFVYLRLDEGAHRVVLEGLLPSNDAFTIAFASIPHRASVRATGWDVDGFRNGDQVGSSLQFRRAIAEAERGADGEAPSSIPVTAWLELTRAFELGIRWEMTTTVRRVSAPGAPLVARIPLFPGESVTSSDATIENGSVVVALGGADFERSWTSVLAPREELRLTTEAGARRTEVWSFSCGTVWRCEFDELSPTRIVDPGGFWSPLYRPFPGDTLVVRAARLAAAEGQSVTIDDVSLALSPGARLTSAVLRMQARSSIGTTHTITLPPDATLQAVSVDGQRRAAEQRGRDVSLTLPPGASSIEVSYQEPRPLDVVYNASELAVSSRAVNVRVTIDRPDRWLLWLSGPAWGPVVLFWPYLLVLIAFALVLARAIDAPLRTFDWLLLGLGLSQLPWQFAWILPSWFALLSWRGKTPAVRSGLFELRQLVIAFWTLVAGSVLYATVHVGLLVDPDTSIAPASWPLEWYVDRLAAREGQTSFVLPQPVIVSLPEWVYHVVMLLWSLWLATRIARWAKWSFEQYGRGSFWKSPIAPPPAPPKAPAAPAPAAALPPVSDVD